MALSQGLKGVYTPSFFEKEVLTAFSGREFSRAQQHEFLSALDLARDKLMLVKQVHGAEVVRVKQDQIPLRALEADGLITQEKGITLGVLTADCLPVFFYDPVKEAIGIAHAGWRGLQAGILERMVNCFQENFHSNAGDLKIAVGPSICKKCYEVGNEFREYFPQSYRFPATSGDKGRLDLIQELKHRFAVLAVPASHILESKICTSCQNDRFFSARCGDKGERILSLIQIFPPVLQ